MKLPTVPSKPSPGVPPAPLLPPGTTNQTLSTFAELVGGKRGGILTGGHDVGAGCRRGHARRLAGDWVPGVGGRQAVQALRDVGVRPDIRRGVVEHLVCTHRWEDECVCVERMELFTHTFG